MTGRGLVVIGTHPVQYHAPVYRCVQQRFGIPVTALYGSDFSVSGAVDREFGAPVAWDTDLLGGYRPVFLSRVAEGGPSTPEDLTGRALGSALKRLAPAAVLLTGYGTRFQRRALLLSGGLGYPLLFRGETTDHAHRRSALRSCVRDFALRLAYGRCDALLYIGEHSRAHYRRLRVDGRKLFFSPYCVDAGTFAAGDEHRRQLRPAARKRLDVAEHQHVLLFSGKLSARKGPDLLLSAVRQLGGAMRERTVVVFLGDGDERARLAAAALARPPVAVRFPGFQNQTQLSPFYHAADVLVLPSRHSETWGLVVNEALHHGVPAVVSSAVGCAPDLVHPGITGDTFENGSAAGLAAAIARTLEWAGLPNTRVACRQKISAYSVERAAQGIADAYAAVVRGAARTGEAAA